MHILAIRPAPAGAGGRTLAHFDVQLTPDCRLFNLKLVDGHSGRLVYAPNAFGERVATFSPSFANDLVRAAGVALGALHASTRRTA
ncbi:hypothetical protein C8K44_11568 [Aminobacter sp. AP02]|nr:hypothetical protein C8K44_11568 [Aminobacter sp. AP02]